jgi:hypothetical protein
MTIIGVVEHLARPNFQIESNEESVIFPVEPSSEKSIESQARSMFDRISTPDVSWSLRTFADQRADLFVADRAALRILVFILVALILVAVNAITIEVS